MPQRRMQEFHRKTQTQRGGRIDDCVPGNRCKGCASEEVDAEKRCDYCDAEIARHCKSQQKPRQLIALELDREQAAKKNCCDKPVRRAIPVADIQTDRRQPE
jgi:hypothetical protein